MEVNGTTHAYTDPSYYDYDEHLYQAYAFERPIYLYIWEILVIITCIFNVVVISVLLRKKMRNSTYMILVAISISDSFTGLVTLPSYIAMYRHNPFESEAPPTIDFSSIDTGNLSINFDDAAGPDLSGLPEHGYFVSKSLCDGFMISKFFLSKSFHTASVWLTLFLALQRFLSVYAAFGRVRDIFSVKRTIGVCVVIFVLAPILHVYHVLKEESPNGFCRWTLETGDKCDTDCAYLWCVTILGQLLPALLLLFFTAYFVYSMRKSTDSLQNMGSQVSSGIQVRQRDNRRVSRVVIAILVVFLIPEVPYAGFLLYNTVSAHADKPTDLKTNRAIHAAYEILLVISFSANFYIYTFFNKRFRRVLKETIILPICNVLYCSAKHTKLPEQPGISKTMTSEGGYSTEMTNFNTGNSK